MASKMMKGRDRSKCKRYFDRGIRERNKAHRLRKHIEAHPADKVAARALKTVAPRKVWRPEVRRDG